MEEAGGLGDNSHSDCYFHVFVFVNMRSPHAEEIISLKLIQFFSISSLFLFPFVFHLSFLSSHSNLCFLMYIPIILYFLFIIRYDYLINLFATFLFIHLYVLKFSSQVTE